MKAVTWQEKRDVRVEEVPDPWIEYPTDAIVKITSSPTCGSDLHEAAQHEAQRHRGSKPQAAQHHDQP